MKRELPGSWNRLTLAISQVRSTGTSVTSLSPPSSPVVSYRNSTSNSNSCKEQSNRRTRPRTAFPSKKSVNRFLPSMKGFSHNDLKSMYTAKCKDLNIPEQTDQERRFYNYCEKCFVNRKIVMKEAGLREMSAKVLGKWLENNLWFSQLVLCKNPLGGKGVLILCESLLKNTGIIHLDLTSTDISSAHFPEIFLLLSKHQSIVSIDFSSVDGIYRNRIGLQGSRTFSLLLQNPILSILNISGTGIGHNGFSCLSEAIRGNRSLLSLNISNNELGHKGLGVFLSALVTTKISELLISGNSLINEGAELLSKFLAGDYKKNTQLRSLDVSRNSISSVGSAQLFESLKNNGVVVYLNIEGNPLTHLSGRAISSCLFFNSTLAHLDISNCDLRDKGVLAFAGTLNANIGLRTLVLSKNHLTSETGTAIAHSLYRNKGLLKVDLSCNSLGNEAGIAFANVIRHNTHIRELNFRQNNLGDKAGDELFEALRVSVNITKITLENNLLSLNNTLKIQEFVRRNLKSLRTTSASTLTKSNCDIKQNNIRSSKIYTLMDRTKQKKRDAELKLRNQLTRLTKNVTSEAAKLKHLETASESLKTHNKSLIHQLKAMQQDIESTKIQAKSHIAQEEEKYMYLIAELKALEKLSNSYTGTTKQSEFNLKQIQLDSTLSQLNTELAQAQTIHNSLQKGLHLIKLPTNVDPAPKRSPNKPRVLHFNRS